MASPGLSSPSVPIVGQPFTVTSLFIPVHATLTCNCGGPETTVTIAASVAAACPSCRKVYNVAFNPVTAKLEFRVGVPPVERVAS